MKILFLGDIFGEPGRKAAKKFLPELKKEHAPNLTIANIENMSHGKGFTPEQIADMRAAGIDFFTSGNHVWKVKEGVAKLSDKSFPVLRPANFPPVCPGRGYQIVQTDMMQRVLVINLQGRVFMHESLDCPFRAFDAILKETAHEQLNAIFVDFHAETTSEKYALGYYADGRASAFVGTHTHVATRDEHIFSGGTAYITDVGFCGPFDSCIGVKKEIVIQRYLNQMPAKHEVADGPVILNAALIEIDPATRKALKITHIQKFLLQ